MKKFRSKTALQIVITSCITIFIVAVVVSAATTIGTNITATGDLTIDTDTLYVDSTNDRVGISSTTPGAALSISALTAQESLRIGSSTITYLVVEDNGDLVVDTDTLFVDNSADNVGISSSTPGWSLSVTDATLGQLALAYDGNGYALFNVDANDDLTITASGGDIDFGDDRIGIGSSTPFSLLSVQGTTTIHPFSISSSTSAYPTFIVDRFDRIGIGSSTPGAMFAITAPSGQESMRVGSSTATDLIIDKYGNVGIGTSTPTYNTKLSITAESGEESLRIGSSTTTYLVVDESGKVGIGSTSPSATLSVGSDLATSTIDLGKACFRITMDNGTTKYFWFSTTIGTAGLASSTSSCF